MDSREFTKEEQFLGSEEKYTSWILDVEKDVEVERCGKTFL